MIFIIDENMPARAATFIANRGHEAHRSVDLLRPQAPDIQIVEVANTLRATIVSNDRDFSQLVKRCPKDAPARYRHVGLIAFRRCQSHVSASKVPSYLCYLDHLYHCRHEPRSRLRRCRATFATVEAARARGDVTQCLGFEGAELPLLPLP